jgi:hypothetical protein
MMDNDKVVQLLDIESQLICIAAVSMPKPGA